jgi:predicted RNase H-like HicB family nuclease
MVHPNTLGDSPGRHIRQRICNCGPAPVTKKPLPKSLIMCYGARMKLTAVFIPAAEGGFTALVEEIPGAISEGETIEEARENLADALRMVLECNRELARQQQPAESRRETMELAVL